jgi:hypothetical protein
MVHEHAGPRPDRDPRHEHEGTDVGFRSLVIFTVVLALAVAAIMVGTKLILDALRAREPEVVSPPAAVAPVQLPPEPRLQPAPARDMEALRAREDAILGTYGWVDRAEGVARIPIDRAIALVARRGLPVASAPQAGTGTPPAQAGAPAAVPGKPAGPAPAQGTVRGQ